MLPCFIEFSKIKMVNGSPIVTVIKKWDLSTVYSAHFDSINVHFKQWNADTIRVKYDSDPTVSYFVKVYMPDNLNYPENYYHSATVKSRFFYRDNIGVDTTISNQCGMRVKSIKNYTQAGKIASNKSIKYYDGKLLNRFKPLTVYKANSSNTSEIIGVGDESICYEYIAFYKKITASGSDFGTNGGNLIGYGKVEEIELSQTSSNIGKKVFWYADTINKTQQDCPNIPNLRNGLIIKEEVYDNSNIKLLEKKYKYKYLQPNPDRFICKRLVRLSTGSRIPCGNWYPSFPPTNIEYYNNHGEPFFNASKYGYNVYSLNSEWNRLDSVITNQYFNGIAVVSSEKYTYDTVGNIKTVTTLNSQKDTLITKYYYPLDKVTSAYDYSMILLHNINIPVKTEYYKGTKFLSSQSIEYGVVADAPTYMPKYIYTKHGSENQEKRVTINSYDNKGNITQYTEENNMPVAIKWNEDKTLPIAKAVNASFANLSSGQNLQNAMVTTYTYSPLVGLTSQTDPKGIPTNYKYDPYMRLAQVLDYNSNILKEYMYHYYSEPSPVLLYYNNARSQVFYKQTCATGYTGNAYTYTVAANSYSSEISQSDADAKATNDLNTNGQNAANANGTCVPATTCTISLVTGCYNLQNSIVNNGTSVSFFMIFYSSATINMGTSTKIATVSSGCRPSVVRTASFNSGGYSGYTTIYPTGDVYLYVYPSINAYTTINLPTMSYTL